MAADVIILDNVKKFFRVYEREAGILEAIKSLFIRKYKKKVALKGISFKVKEGEILGFIGPNGAGKSTAIKAMCGVLYVDSGKVKCLGFDPWEERIKYVSNIGAVFGQKSQLSWDIPALDSYHLMKAIYDIPEKEFKQRLNYLVNLLDLKSIVKQPVRSLSLGERMKCELIAAMLHNPKIVFLDEPTIGVDILAKDKIRNFIREVNQKYKTTFIVTTHDMSDIEKLCRRAIIINHGEIVFDGLIDEIKETFATEKIIEVKLNDKLTSLPRFPEGVKIIKTSDYELKLEINTRKIRVNKVVKKIMSEYDVLDILISNPDIEEIIKDIYRQ